MDASPGYYFIDEGNPGGDNVNLFPSTEVKMSKPIRKPAVAGMFYPEDPDILRAQVTAFIDHAKPPEASGPLLGVISPHAGYMYSGPCAGFAYRALRDTPFDRAVMIAPSHRYGGYDFSVGDYQALETPLGLVPVDARSVERLLIRNRAGFLPAAHLHEHSLEVQLPFLQVIRPDVTVAPIILGNQSLENSLALADLLAEVFADEMERTVFIVSSDLSHYHDESTAFEMDHRLINLIERGNLDDLQREIEEGGCEACGFGGILALLALAKNLGSSGVRLLHYTHSGETTGDGRQVVGYLSAGVWR
jgi:MEMO1 family protein